MIVVKIELWPHGYESAKKALGEIRIANVGGTATSGNYKFRAADRGGRDWKQGTLEGFPRKRLLSYDLLYRCLKAMVGERNV